MQQGEMIAAVLGGAGVAALSGAFQIILFVLNRRAKKKDEESGDAKHIKNALCVILYDRIKYLARHHIGAGYVCVEDLEDLTKMHTSYQQDLGGNGFLDNLMKQAKALPLHK